MRAGRLSDSIVFEKPTVTTPSGYRTVVWAPDTAIGVNGAVPCEPERIGETTARFIVRYMDSITPASHQITWDGHTWRITSTVHDRRRTMLTIDCEISTFVESTDLDSETTEYVANVPVVQPPD